jgi:serine/threonine protein kinase/tetratricopeptide (TPR) repeat protein
MAVDPARVKSLFLTASDLEGPGERAAFLDRECASDAGLRARVEALLRANDAAPMPPFDAETGTSAYARDGASPTEDFHDSTAHVGSVLGGKYKLIEAIGEGGMGQVFLAQQTEPVKRAVAVKVIKAGMDSRAVLTRFEAERQALAMMDHPNIAKVLDAGATDGGRPFFVMELVKGTSITKFCDERKLTPRQRLELFVPVCHAIQHAHQKGVIHRDVKPSNVLVAMYDDKPVVKVIDFGVAKAAGQALTEKTLMTGLGAVVGTAEYMSPEQASLNNLDIDTRSDVYSLGVLLYELLTGATPIDRKSLGKAALLEILRIVREVEAPRPSAKLSTSDALPTLSANRGTEPKKLTGLLRSELDWIVMKALEKDRARRYETANGFAADILRFLSGEAVQAHPPSAAYRLTKFVRRHKGQVIAAGAVMVALLLGTAGTTWGMFEAKRSADAERSARLDAVEHAERAQKRLEQIEKANATLGSIFENLDPREIAKAERPLQAILVEKLDQAATQLEGESIGDPLVVAGMQTKFGNSLLGLGEPAKAIALLEKARATFQSHLGLENPETLSRMSSLAWAYLEAGKLNLALPLHEETLKLRKAKLGADHPATLISMNNLAATYQTVGKRSLALALHEETYKLCKAKHGPDHPDTLASMYGLAVSYRSAGKLDLALPLFEESLELHRGKYGPTHPHTLVGMGNLASAYRSCGKLEAAMALYDETLTLRKIHLGPDHPDTLVSMNDLAVAFQDARKRDQAMALFVGTLKLRKARLGAEHPLTLQSMSNLATAYRDAGKLDLAIPLHEETLGLRKAKLGPDHPATLNSMNNVAAAYWSAKRLDRSIPLFEELLRLSEGKLGRDHPETLLAVGNLGANYLAANRLSEAIPLLEEVNRSGNKHYSLRGFVVPLRDAYMKAGQDVKLISLLAEQASTARATLPKDSLQLAGLLAQIGGVLLERKQWPSAEPLLRECLTIREKKEPDDWRTSNTQSLLGGALLGQKKFADAEPLLRKGYEGMKARAEAIPAGGKARLPEALDRLIELSIAANKPDDVKKWQDERAKYPPSRPAGKN